MKKQNEYKIDHIAQTIIISKKFSKAAGILGTNEYDTLKQLRTDYPDYSLRLREIAKKKNKKSYINLTFKAMRNHIEIIKGKKSKEIHDYETILKLAEGQPGPYAFVKKWFLDKYPDYKDVAKVFNQEPEKSNDNDEETEINENNETK